jgi:hypothetical protein
MKATIKSRLEFIRKELAEIAEVTNIKDQEYAADHAALLVHVAILAGEKKLGE